MSVFPRLWMSASSSATSTVCFAAGTAIAFEAAMTGHFVLSTLHTNDPPSALTRLIDIGVEAPLAGAAVTAVLSQRLVRRVCTDCRSRVDANEEELTSIGFSEAQIARGVTMYEKPRLRHLQRTTRSRAV